MIQPDQTYACFYSSTSNIPNIKLPLTLTLLEGLYYWHEDLQRITKVDL
jgi:hypothetical protein